MTDKERFLTILRSVKREGIDAIINYLESSSFFKDPASARYHGNFEGGLCKHSLAVYDKLVELSGRDDDTVKICSLLHDICKVGSYKVDYKNVKNELGVWEKVPYYSFAEDMFPFGHGEKSVFIISQYMNLSLEEVLAIRWHMGSYEPKELWQTLESARKMYDLVIYIHMADVLASTKIA